MHAVAIDGLWGQIAITRHGVEANRWGKVLIIRGQEGRGWLICGGNLSAGVGVAAPPAMRGLARIKPGTDHHWLLAEALL